MTNPAHPTLAPQAVAEIVTFALKPGVSDDAFLALMRTSEGFTSYAPGFVSRRLSKGPDGRWTDYVLWDTLDAAQSAAADFMAQDFAPAIVGAIDKDSFQMTHQHIMWQPG